MANTRTYNRSFAGGEISEQMFGRIDDVKYQTGAAKMRNIIATPQGPAENRAGFAFVRATKDNGSAKLIPFTYSTDQTMMIEVGAGYFRFHTHGATLLSGGVPYEVANPYAEADLFDLHYVQSADVLTLVHPNYAPRELRRLGATNWTLTTIAFAPAISAPAGVSVTPSPGFKAKITNVSLANPAVITTASNHTLVLADPSYIKDLTATVAGVPVSKDGDYLVNLVPKDGDGAPIPNQLQVMDYSGNILDASGWSAVDFSNATIQYGGKIADRNNYYVVTAIAANGVDESAISAEVSALNNLNVSGSFNTIGWGAVTGAERYRVYKKKNGLHGFIGETTSTSFVDNNIAPDMGIAPPTYETVFNGENKYPAAVSYYEQRRCFAGTNNQPQNFWMTKSGTESNFSYSLPTTDSDRIAFRVASREANTIRHIVPLTQLILLTSSAEIRVSPVNSDAITPTTVTARPQSFVGASNVQPSIINNSLVYAAARGGHVRELGYSWQANGFTTGDLSLRASHLFDNLEIVDQCARKSPLPIIWFVSSNGKLLGLTYIPEEQIGAWHQHDTDGVFESIAAVAEGAEDRLYAVIRRTVDGQTVRYIERMASRLFERQVDCFFVDSGATFDGTNLTATTVSIAAEEGSGLVTLTASSAIFAYPATTDKNDAIVVTAEDGSKYRLTIYDTSSTTVARALVAADIAAQLDEYSTSAWAWARNTISGLTWLEGKKVSILGDGAVHPQQVVTDGVITLQSPVVIAHVGLPYQSDLQTLPVVLGIDGYGQGRTKNINKAWVKVWRSGGIRVGPDPDNLRTSKPRSTEPYGAPPALKDNELLEVSRPDWDWYGQIYVRQEDPLPLTILGVTLEVAIGG